MKHGFEIDFGDFNYFYCEHSNKENLWYLICVQTELGREIVKSNYEIDETDKEEIKNILKDIIPKNETKLFIGVRRIDDLILVYKVVNDNFTDGIDSLLTFLLSRPEEEPIGLSPEEVFYEAYDYDSFDNDIKAVFNPYNCKLLGCFKTPEKKRKQLKRTKNYWIEFRKKNINICPINIGMNYIRKNRIFLLTANLISDCLTGLRRKLISII